MASHAPSTPRTTRLAKSLHWLKTTLTIPRPHRSSKDVRRFKNHVLKTTDSRSRLLAKPIGIRHNLYKTILSACPRIYFLDRGKTHWANLPDFLAPKDVVTDEAAAYYWSTGHFELILEHDDSRAFPRFLHFIGPRNAHLLSQNPDVCIRLTFHPQPDCPAADFANKRLLGTCYERFLGGPTEHTQHWYFIPEEAPAPPPPRDRFRFAHPKSPSFLHSHRLKRTIEGVTQLWGRETASTHLRLQALLCGVSQEVFAAFVAMEGVGEEVEGKCGRRWKRICEAVRMGFEGCWVGDVDLI